MPFFQISAGVNSGNVNFSTFFQNGYGIQQYTDFYDGVPSVNIDYYVFGFPFHLGGGKVYINDGLSMTGSGSKYYGFEIDGGPFVVGADTVLTGGYVRNITVWHADGIFQADGILVNAQALSDVMHTAHTADDFRLFKTFFADNDLIITTSTGIVADAGRGDDLIRDAVGANTLLGGAGNDMILANDDNDYLVGGSGSDILLGGEGNDTIRGSFGDDVIWAGSEADVILGGRGTDTFLFELGEGKARIMDYAPGKDQIYFNVAAPELSNLVISMSGADTVLTLSDLTITLADVDRTLLLASDIHADGAAFITSAAMAYLYNWHYDF